jgi:hypothetical protein
MTLAAATAAVRQASGDPEQEVASMEAHDRLRRQLVPSLWTVCWQAPEAGTVVEGPTWVGAGVTRLGTACWD